MRIAINGMGRIGRLLFRRLIEMKGIDLVAVNDPMETGNLAYLLNYDSIYGTFPTKVLDSGNRLVVNEKQVNTFRQLNPSQLPWKELGIDVVLECSGQFTTRDKASLHLQAGAKKVLLSTTGSSDIPLLIYGFNQHLLHDSVNIVSPGGCMTNCVTHIFFILNSNCKFNSNSNSNCISNSNFNCCSFSKSLYRFVDSIPSITGICKSVKTISNF